MDDRDQESRHLFKVLNTLNKDESIPAFVFEESNSEIKIRPREMANRFCQAVLSRNRKNNRIIVFFSPVHATKCISIEFTYSPEEALTIAADIADYYKTGLLPFRI